jgi:predicted SAM-dependent methyltransferase/predicted Zn-ribbon and HTH transcriptional regulator
MTRMRPRARREGVTIANRKSKITNPMATLVKKVRQKARSLYLKFPKNVECNICGWSGRHLASDDWHEHSVCWRCRSQVRHRLMVEALSRLDGLTYKDLVDGKSVLHFSPEVQTTPLLRPRAGSYRTADFMREDVDEQLDLTNMPSVAAGSVDLLVAADVLEHVPDHIQGMREILRVLAPGGCAILTVPQQDNLEKTWGDPSITDPEKRLQLFGQRDHVRIFGNDMPELLKSAGFEVRVITEKDFPPELVKKHVLFPPILSTRPLATNYRKVFFACKVQKRS